MLSHPLKKTIAVLLLAAALGGAWLALKNSPPPAGESCDKKLAEVVLIQFPGIKHSVKREEVEQKFRDLDSYLRELSYGKVCLSAKVTEKWYTMPQPLSAYKVGPGTKASGRRPVARLLRDVLAAAAGEVAFDRTPHIFFYLGATRKQFGAAAMYAYSGAPGLDPGRALTTPDGKQVTGQISILNSHAFLGNLAHETLIHLGGSRDGKLVLPPLNDRTRKGKVAGNARDSFVASLVYMGFWDTMSCHCYKCVTEPAVGLSSWTRLRLGWLDPKKVRTVDPRKETEVLLAPLGDGAGKTLAVKIPLSPQTYYLLENRQPIGYDKNLPGKGVLLLYGDDGVRECGNGLAPVRLVDANPATPHLNGAAFSPEGQSEFIDADRGLRIELREFLNGSYRIKIGPYSWAR
ncbi:MAG: hypothetical protein NDI60_08080 [Elusimicrobiales bacterium]|nr:hypothetical protein [Elusimicrobiales bacterium]